MAQPVESRQKTVISSARPVVSRLWCLLRLVFMDLFFVADKPVPSQKLSGEFSHKHSVAAMVNAWQQSQSSNIALKVSSEFG